jgi:hypothetical protein
MRKTTALLLVIFLGAALYFHIQSKPERSIAIIPYKWASAETAAKRVGEEIVYDIKYGAVTIGTSRFNCLADSRIDGSAVNVMTLNTSAPHFKDTETVYSYPDSNLPLRVERYISRWPVWEKITEEYDQKNFTVNITKNNGTKNVIKKEGVIYNAVLLPYFIRRADNLNPGWAIAVTLPTQQFSVTLVSVEDLTVPAGTFRTYHFKSDPKKFEIWITADERRIPVKIQGLGVFGYSMLMRKYH